jgi:hypothetical protein
MTEEKQDTVDLKEHKDLAIFFQVESLFQINTKHFGKPIAPPLTIKQTEGCSFANILEIFERTEIGVDVLEMWKGYAEMQLFSSKDDVQSKLETYTHYLANVSEDIVQMVAAIAYDLVTFPEKYDAAGVCMALAQNGGVCNVQKEIGIRAVYADMMNSMMEHMQASSVETKVLTLLKRNRLALSELVAMEYCGWKRTENQKLFNSHIVTPFQVAIAEKIGIERVSDPDSRGQQINLDIAFAIFMKKYTVEHVVKLLDEALNSSHRVINYHDCIDYFEKIKPMEVDSYTFLNEFVFNVETGKFTSKGIKYLLFQLDVLELKPEPKEESKPITEPKKKRRKKKKKSKGSVKEQKQKYDSNEIDEED